MSVTFESVEISREKWGSNEGKLKAKITLTTGSVYLTCLLSANTGAKLIASCVTEIAASAKESTDGLAKELMDLLKQEAIEGEVKK